MQQQQAGMDLTKEGQLYLAEDTILLISINNKEDDNNDNHTNHKKQQ